MYTINFYVVTSMLWSAAFGIGTQVLVAHRAGARDFVRANTTLNRALLIGTVGSLLFCALLTIWRRSLLGALTSDRQIQQLAAPLFPIGFLVEPGRAANIIAGGALRSTGIVCPQVLRWLSQPIVECLDSWS